MHTCLDLAVHAHLFIDREKIVVDREYAKHEQQPLDVHPIALLCMQLEIARCA
jgi:hypothetical protein